MKKNSLIIFFFIFLIIFFIKIAYSFSFAYKTTINNNFIGYYYNEEEYQNLIKEIEKQKNSDFEEHNFVCANPSFEKVIVRKTVLNKYNKNELIKPFITQEYFLYELIYKNNSYYFKSEEEANNFKNEILKISDKEKITITKINSTDTNLITKEEDLKKLLQQIKTENKKITSRSGTISRTKNNSSKVLENYNYISSYYRTSSRQNHTGVDFAAPYGTSIYSWKNGTVELAKWNGNYGNMVIVNHGNGQKSRYAHLSSICCSIGQKVNAGQLIGKVGSTGNSTGNHLHFEIMINNVFVNPLNYL